MPPLALGDPQRDPGPRGQDLAYTVPCLAGGELAVFLILQVDAELTLAPPAPPGAAGAAVVAVADVGDVQIVATRFQDLVDLSIQRLGLSLGVLARRIDTDHHLTFHGARTERAFDGAEQVERRPEHSQDRQHEDEPVAQCEVQDSSVAPRHPVDERRRACGLVAQDHRGDHRHHGQGDHHGRHDHDTDRDTDILHVDLEAPRRTEEDQREEDAHRGRGGGHDGQRDLGGALQRRTAGILVQLVSMAEDRLDDHDRVIHEHAEREHQTRQTDHVERDIEHSRLAQEVDQHEGGDHRDGHGHRDQRRRAEPAQEEEDGQDRHCPADQSGVPQLPQSLEHILGGVGVDVDLNALRLGQQPNLLEFILDRLDHLQQVARRGLGDAHGQRLDAVEEVEPVLLGQPVDHVGHVGQPQTAVVDRQVGDLTRCGELAHHADQQLAAPLLDIPRREVDVVLT